MIQTQMLSPISIGLAALLSTTLVETITVADARTLLISIENEEHKRSSSADLFVWLDF